MAQRLENGFVIISCDFCRTDWDGASPAVEGHRGSIICLECLKAGLGSLEPAEAPFDCILCLRSRIPALVGRWHHHANPDVFACGGCLRQAAEAFSKDPDIDFHWENSA